VLFAGASAADHILELDGAFYDAQIAGDLYQIKATMAAHSKLFSAHARHLFVRDCRSHAEAMVRIPLVEQAIRDVAIALESFERGCWLTKSKGFMEDEPRSCRGGSIESGLDR
jgi:hypothetical protein